VKTEKKRVPLSPMKSLLFPLGFLLLLHFRNPDIFSRSLIRFDDHAFIEPIQNLSLSAYFSEWLPKKDSFAFPLRDLTFMADFSLSRLLDFQTFWITQAALFIAVALTWHQLLQRILGAHALWVFVPWLFHPLSVEIVQWISNRKHLLVALWTGLGTLLAFKLREQGKTPQPREIGQFLLLALASWLCWPTGILWIFWVIALFWTFRPKFPHWKLLVVPALALTLLATTLTRSANNDFSKTTDFVQKADTLVQSLRFGVEGIGRGFFSLVFPFFLAPYYRLGAWQNFAGLVLLAVFIVLAARRFPKLPQEQKHRAWIFLSLSLSLLLPTGAIFLSYTEFVWADRYLFLPLPALLVASFLIFGKTKETPARGFKATSLFISALFFITAWFKVPAWTRASDLFDACAAREGSPKCVQLAVEARFDEDECSRAPEHFIKARALAAQGPWLEDSSFRTELPLYESLCIAAVPVSIAQKTQMLEEMKKAYPQTYYAGIGEILTRLSAGQVDEALNQALKTYLAPTDPIPESSVKLLSVIMGQAEALCVLAGLQKSGATAKMTLDRGAPLAQLCNERRALLAQRLASTPLKEKQRSWAFHRTIHAYNLSRADSQSGSQTGKTSPP
jgi:hypothetical protein